jgi:hypothetical protein
MITPYHKDSGLLKRIARKRCATSAEQVINALSKKGFEVSRMLEDGTALMTLRGRGRSFYAEVDPNGDVNGTTLADYLEQTDDLPKPYTEEQEEEDDLRMRRQDPSCSEYEP